MTTIPLLPCKQTTVKYTEILIGQYTSSLVQLPSLLINILPLLLYYTFFSDIYFLGRLALDCSLQSGSIGRLNSILKFCKVVAVHMILYESENWAIKISEERKIETNEMMSNYWLQTVRSNEQHRNEKRYICFSPCGTRKIKSQQLEHIEGMYFARFSKYILKY